MNYPSDISKKQFEEILPILEKVKKTTRPRVLDLYDVFNALLYVVVTGCQWRALPKEYPKWKSVHYYFTIWSEKNDENSSALEEVLKKINRLGAYQEWQKMLNIPVNNRRSKC
jgi:transposase